VGKTKKSDKSRQLSQLGYYPFPLLEWTFKIKDYSNAETDIHRHLRNNKCNGDWYNINVLKVIEYIMNKYEWTELDAPSPVKILSTIGSVL